ncbi:MAG: ABC transporter substrate-binding protein [Dongiaceae bacterium]
MSLRTLLENTHSYLPKLAQQFKDGKVNRREFLRTSTLLGLSSAVAFSIAGLPETGRLTKSARAAGGTVRLSMRVQPIESPHTYSWIQDSMMSRNVIEYLTITGSDNITRPWLCEKWEASDDLKTWTLSLRKDVKWSNGEPFLADHVVWNIKRCLDPATGSSVLGLMKGYMMNDAGDALWDANAVEKVDDNTVRLNARVPQLAVPEHFFHYPFPMMHPSSEGKFPGVGSIGTGWADMVEYELGKKCVVRKRSEPYWAGGGHLDTVEYIDHGDDPAAALGALASGQVDGLWRAEISQLAAVRKMDHIQLYESATAQTAVARMQPIHDTWKDPKIRKAMRLAIDTEKVLGVAHAGLGLPGEHHHVCPIHPEYAKLPFMKQDIEGAKKLLAEAGKPDGFEAELFANADDDWEARACNAMAEMWKQAGINIKVSVLPGAQYWEIWTAETAPFACTSWTHRPLGVMVLGLAYRTGVPWNESHWSNAEFDKLLSEAEGLLDVEERRKVVEKIEVLMQEEGPVVQPLWRSVFMAMDKKVKGFAAHPTQYIFPWDWSLEA